MRRLKKLVKNSHGIIWQNISLSNTKNEGAIIYRLGDGKKVKKVTVVVPVYNAEKYLNECVESIRNQTYKNLEIILVDDGAKDSSPQLCDILQKKDDRIRVIHKENEGAGKSRNRGIEAATGEYIVFVDSDDYIKPDLVKKCMDAIAGNDAAMVMYGVQHIGKTGKVIGEKVPYSDKYVFEKKEVQEVLLPEIVFSENKKVRNLETPASMANFYSLGVIKKIGWKFESEREYISEDFYSILNLYRYIDKLVVLNEALYCYRHGHESLSSSSRLMNYGMIRKYYNQCVLLCEKNGYSDKVLRNISEPYLSFTITCLKMKARQEKSLKDRRLEMNEILQDNQLYEVLTKRNLKNEKKSKQVLYKAILTKNYVLARLLIYMQAYRSNR